MSTRRNKFYRTAKPPRGKGHKRSTLRHRHLRAEAASHILAYHTDVFREDAELVSEPLAKRVDHLARLMNEQVLAVPLSGGRV